MNTNQVKYSYSTSYFAHCKKNKVVPSNSFVKWINSVEDQVYEILGHGLTDLPDEPYFVNFEDGVSSKDMAEHVIKENCYLIMNNAYGVRANY